MRLAVPRRPLVTIAHQDDAYCPDYSTRMLAAVNSVTDPLLFFTDYGELRDGKEVDNNTLLQAKRRLLYPLRDGRHATSWLVRRRALSLGCAICCPSVTLNLALLSTPPFSNSFKCDLDWDAWERASRLKGSFYYGSSILMYHRIHAGSETTALIMDSTRTTLCCADFGPSRLPRQSTQFTVRAKTATDKSYSPLATMLETICTALARGWRQPFRYPNLNREFATLW